MSVVATLEASLTVLVPPCGSLTRMLVTVDPEKVWLNVFPMG